MYWLRLSKNHLSLLCNALFKNSSQTKYFKFWTKLKSFNSNLQLWRISSPPWKGSLHGWTQNISQREKPTVRRMWKNDDRWQQTHWALGNFFNLFLKFIFKCLYRKDHQMCFYLFSKNTFSLNNFGMSIISFISLLESEDCMLADVIF